MRDQPVQIGWSVVLCIAPTGRFSQADILLPTHEGALRLRDTHAPIGLLVYLEDGDQDAWRGDGCVFQRMHELPLTILIAIADVDAPRLPLVEAGAGMCLAIAFLEAKKQQAGQYGVCILMLRSLRCLRPPSHPVNEEHHGLLLFNPGSATDRIRQPRSSIGMLNVDDETKSV